MQTMLAGVTNNAVPQHPTRVRILVKLVVSISRSNAGSVGEWLISFNGELKQLNRAARA